MPQRAKPPISACALIPRTILVGFRRRNGRGDIDAVRAVQLGIIMTLKAADHIGG